MHYVVFIPLGIIPVVDDECRCGCLPCIDNVTDTAAAHNIMLCKLQSNGNYWNHPSIYNTGGGRIIHILVCVWWRVLNL